MQKVIKLKPIRCPLSHEMTYRSAMLVIIEQMRQQLYNELTSNNAQTNFQYQKTIDELFAQYMDNPMLGVSLATSFVKSLDKYHQKLFLSGVKQAIGVNVNDFISKSAMNDLMQQAISWNVELIKSIPAELLPQVKQVVAQSFSEIGFDQANLKKEIDKRFNVTKSRAKLIARDQTSKTVGSMTQFRQKALGIDEYIWLGVADNRERQSHLDNNNKRFSYNNPPADTGNPSHDVNCLPEYSEINATSSINKFFRRMFTGELTEIVTSSGDVLHCTSNHPILTSKGWKAAKDIDLFDNVAKTVNKTSNIIELYGKNIIPTIGQMFDSIQSFNLGASVAPNTSGNFHGDISDNDIDIIDMARFMSDGIHLKLFEQIKKLNLTDSDMMLACSFFSSFGCSNALRERFTNSFDSFMGILDLIHSSIIIHLSPFELFAFALGSWGDFIMNKDHSHITSSDLKIFRNSIFAYSVLIHGNDVVANKLQIARQGFKPLCDIDTISCTEVKESGAVDIEYFTNLAVSNSGIDKFDNVVAIHTSPFEGYVYNMETLYHNYTSANTIFHNCRCVAQGIITEKILNNLVYNKAKVI